MKDGDIWKSLENDIEVKNDTSEIELNNLKAGIYKLTETTAPKGYSLLGKEYLLQSCNRKCNTC